MVATVATVRADNPSPTGWNLSGGGFCQGNFTNFNTSLTPNPGIYGENCQTGKNQFFSATDAGSVVDSEIATLTTTGGQISFRSGLFSLVTPINLNAQSGVSMTGIGSDNSDPVYPAFTLERNGTTLVAQTLGMTMIKGSASPLYSCCGGAGGGSRCNAGITISNLELYSNNKAATGIDFSCAEEGGLANLISHVQVLGCRNVAACIGFTTAGIILDGNEDSFLEYSRLGQCGACNGITDNTVDVQWRVGAGNVNMIDNVLVGGLGLYTCAQTVTISGGTMSSLKLFAGGSGCPTNSIWMLYVSGVYYATNVGVSNIILNGQALESAKFDGNFIGINSAHPMISGAGTIQNLSFSANNFQESSGSWNSGGATIQKDTSLGDNHAHNFNNCAGGACFTGFPFTVDANGNF